MSQTDSASSSRFAGLGTVVLMLVLAVALPVLFVTAWQHGQTKAPAAAPDTVAALRERVAADEARLAALERKVREIPRAAVAPPSSAATAQPAPDAQARLADLDLRLAALERGAPAADLAQRIAALDAAQSAEAARIAKLEAFDPSATMRRAAAELAFANLVRASAQGPFAAELKTFHALMPDADEANALSAIAPHGAPAAADLARQFPSIASRALAAERASGATTWLGRLWAGLSNLVVVRRIGDAKGADSEAILARAGARLDAGDLAGAVAQLRALKGSAKATLAPWLAEAQARLAVDRALTALAGRMAQALARP
jgi:hypothetical protein